MRKTGIGAAVLLALALASCGKSEEQIRTEERLRIAEERLAELEEAESASSAEAQESEAQPVDGPSQAEPEPAQAAAEVVSSSDSRIERIGLYKAFIGADDLYNSQGDRLTQPWQVLRQDRANYHRFGRRQAGDTGDEFFSSGRNREIMEQMVRQGRIAADARRLILQGGAVVSVEIFGRNDRGSYVRVTVG